MSESSVDEAPCAEAPGERPGHASGPWVCAVAATTVVFGMAFVGLTTASLDLYARAATGTLLVVGGVSFVLQRGLKLKAASGRADARTLSLSAALGVSLALFGVGALGTMSAVSPWAASRVARASAHLYELLRPDEPGMIPVVLLVVAVLPAVMEEWLFRGTMREALARKSEAYRVLVLGLLFGLIHAEPVHVLPLIYVGMVLTLLAERSGGMVAPMVAHFALNATNGVVSPRIWSEPPGLLVSALLLSVGVTLSTFFVARVARN